MSEASGKNTDRVAPLSEEEEDVDSTFKLAQQAHDIHDDESKLKTDTTITARKDTDSEREKTESPASFEKALRQILETARAMGQDLPPAVDRSCRFMGECAKLFGFDKNTGAAVIGRSDSIS